MEFSTLKLWTCLFVLLVFASLNVTAVEKAGIEPATIVTVNNTYVEIAVADNTKFTVGTKQGDPANANDDNQILMFGHPSPWSSFTSLRINGSNYLYGTGTIAVTAPTTSTNAITLTETIADIVITQTLTIVTSSTTGRQIPWRLNIP